MSPRTSVLPILLLAFLFAQCSSFTLRYQSAAQVSKGSCVTRIEAMSPGLFGSRRTRNVGLFMTSEDSKEQEETESKPDVVAADEDDEDSTDQKRGVVKTVLLTVPLFCKFVVVLLIKFVTDLIVFPLLFLYRLAGVAKRKILKAFGSNEKMDKANGEH